MRSSIVIRNLITTLFIIFSQFSNAYATNFYVSPSGLDANDGSLANPFLTIQKGLDIALAGDTIFLRNGLYDERLTFPNNGSAGSYITIKAYDGEVATLQQTQSPTSYAIDITKAYIKFENLIVDGQWNQRDIIKLRSEAHYCILKGLEIKNTMRDAVDMTAPEGVLIEDCTIHDAIWFSDNSRYDAHGIVTEGVQNLVIRNTEIFYVSGDAIQLQYDGWDQVSIEGCTLWNGPLPSARGGAEAGVNPGENAVDTKYYVQHGRGRLNITDTIAYGWYPSGTSMTNAAAFNIKQNVEAIVDRVTVYDSEIGFRLRGQSESDKQKPANLQRGGAWVTLRNVVIFDTLTAVRYEDNLENLHIYNMTFGDGLNTMFEKAAVSQTVGFDTRNNLFFGSLPSHPASLSDPSNINVDAASFIDVSSNNYHLAEGSIAINSGVTITEVLTDRDGLSRTAGSYDIGAYEFTQTAKGDVNNDSKVDLVDLIISAKICAGIDIENVDLNADVDGDMKISMAEMLFILAFLSQ